MKCLLNFIFIGSLIISAGCGGSSSTNGGNGNGDQPFPNDGNCDGPAIGQGSNDSDNTFRSLAVHPIDPNTVMIGSEGNGIFRSTDGGATWTWLKNGLFYQTMSVCEYPEIYELIFDKNDPTKIYAATTSGPGKDNSPGGFYYSTDSGENWTRSVEDLHNYATTSIAQDPLNSAVLYIGLDNAPSTQSNSTATYEGPNIYKSTDGGLAWTGLTLPVNNNRINNIVIHPTDPNIIYCAGYDNYSTDPLSANHLGFAKSTDAGTSWTQINSGLPSLRLNYIYMDPSNPDTLYGTVWTDQGAEVYKTTDRGSSWTKLQGDATVNNFYNLKVSPFNSNTLIGGMSGGIVSTTSGGPPWNIALNFSDPDFRYTDMEYTSSATIVYASSDYLKVFISQDGGVSFTATVGDIQTLIGH